MGYDKPDLGFVIHYQAPASIIAYYQQVGRAGRSIDNAFGILMTGMEDESIVKHFRRTAFPKQQWVAAILEALEQSDGLSSIEIEKQLNLRRSQINQVLKFLSVESSPPIVKLGSEWKRTQTDYQMDHEQILRISEKRESEWDEVQRYVDHNGCLMQFLSDALDDDNSHPCGKCAPCLGRTVVPQMIGRNSAILASRFLRRSEFVLKCRVMVPKDGLSECGLRGNLNTLRAEEGRVFSRWRDAGWGTIVADDKQKDHFRIPLVNAVAEMIKDRWKPLPVPVWVTCVPSLAHPTLVPDFARRLAIELGLQFDDVVSKVKDNRPQKEQENTFHQCKNLDGVFAVSTPVRDTPVLLIDDIVDSGWTMTVVAALLRKAGSGSVFPLALSTTSMGA